MVHWYQWYDWYQWKSTLFQLLYWWICISLRGLWLFSHVTWLGTGQFQWSIGANGTIGTNGKAPYSNGCIGEYASHYFDYFPLWPGWVQGNSSGPLVPMVRLVPTEKQPVPVVVLVNMHLIKGTYIIFSCGLKIRKIKLQKIVGNLLEKLRKLYMKGTFI